jgi:hypothetical protein
MPPAKGEAAAPRDAQARVAKAGRATRALMQGARQDQVLAAADRAIAMVAPARNRERRGPPSMRRTQGPPEVRAVPVAAL